MSWYFLTRKLLGKGTTATERQWNREYTEKTQIRKEIQKNMITALFLCGIICRGWRMPAGFWRRSGRRRRRVLSDDAWRSHWAIPDGDSMMDFAVQMLEEPEELNEQSERRLENALDFAEKVNSTGHLLDGFALCSDYCFNVNPFFTPDQFDEFIVPYLKRVIDEYRKMGYYTIKHTDGNIMPIVKQMADCGPDAIHSLDPQGNVNLWEVRKIVGDKIALVGNVNCGLLQTGTDEECDADVMRALREGMADGKGYIFSTSNCVYTGLPLERYERMWKLWREVRRVSGK